MSFEARANSNDFVLLSIEYVCILGVQRNIGITIWPKISGDCTKAVKAKNHT